MARIFPDPPPGEFGPEELSVYHAIRAVPCREILAWKALPLSEEWHPAWMLLVPGRLCYLLSIPRIGISDEDAREKVVIAENGRMRQFLASCLAEKGAPIYGAVIFPDVPQDDLDALQRRIPQVDTALWGREIIDPLAILQILRETPAPKPLGENVVARLRKKLCPELTIPANLVANPRSGPHLGAGPRLTSHLLDLDQEYLSKQDLLPCPIPSNEVGPEKIQIVTGAAGSGKSLVLLHRAALQERLWPSARILAITHNKPLCHEMQRRLRKIHPATKIQWQTFYRFCGNFHDRSRELISESRRNEFFKEKAATFTELEALPLVFIYEEIDWIRDQGFDLAEDYLAAERQGRRRPLDQKQRAELLKLLELYRAFLEEQDFTDWTGVAENTWRKVRAGSVVLPIFDLIFIDEAQFFAPLWFRLLMRCLEPDVGRIFLATDPTQGFLRRGNSWRATGFAERSLTTRLPKVYRNSRAILEFATGFYRRRLPGEEEDVQLADLSAADDLPQGEPPLFIQLKAFEDESSVAIYEILAALDAGTNPAHFLVILNGVYVRDFVEKLNRLHGSIIAVDAKEAEAQTGRYVRVTTLNATTGLESAIVFLCGLDALLAPETENTLDPSENEERHQDRTRQIYMALTRASRQLCITHRSPEVREILAGGGMPH